MGEREGWRRAEVLHGIGDTREGSALRFALIPLTVFQGNRYFREFVFTITILVEYSTQKLSQLLYPIQDIHHWTHLDPQEST